MTSEKEKKECLGIIWDDNAIPDLETFQREEIRMGLFRLKKILPDFVFQDGFLEGNPITWPEVKTLMDGVSIGGHKLSDVEQILNLQRAWTTLVTLVQDKKFSLTKEVFLKINALVVFEESLEWGVFRNGPVSIAGTSYKPPAWNRLPEIFDRGLSFIRSLDHPIERALVFSLWTAREQFFWDGNKRTGRIMMAGELLRNGFDAISIPNVRKEEYNRKMVRFYDTGNATEMLDFHLSLFPLEIFKKHEEILEKENFDTEIGQNPKNPGFDLEP